VGTEVQLSRDGALVIGRRFEYRALALLWGEQERFGDRRNGDRPRLRVSLTIAVQMGEGLLGDVQRGEGP